MTQISILITWKQLCWGSLEKVSGSVFLVASSPLGNAKPQALHSHGKIEATSPPCCQDTDLFCQCFWSGYRLLWGRRWELAGDLKICLLEREKSGASKVLEKFQKEFQKLPQPGKDCCLPSAASGVRGVHCGQAISGTAARTALVYSEHIAVYIQGLYNTVQVLSECGCIWQDSSNQKYAFTRPHYHYFLSW